jgi:hypothetical protein
MTSSNIDAISVCITSSHSLLDVMLEMSIDSVRALPIFNFARMAYASIILARLYVSIRCTTSLIGKLLDRETLKIGIYLPAMINRLSEAVGPMECRAPATFLGLLRRLQAWYEHQEMHEELMVPVKLPCPDQFTPTMAFASNNATSEEYSFGNCVPPPTQLPVNLENLAPPRDHVGRVDPFRDFFSPEQSFTNELPTMSDHYATSIEAGDDFPFDPQQIDFDFDFDFDPYLLPGEMGFLDVGSKEMKLSGGDGGEREPEKDH